MDDRWKSPPITSYGVILCSKSPSGEDQFLLYQRRDTFSYMDFLRGLWKSKRQLQTLFFTMTKEEITRIREYTFQELWSDLWVDQKCSLYVDMYPFAYKRYKSIKNIIPNLIDRSDTKLLHTAWGFPKGKKNSSYEEETVCSKREFTEETRIDIGNVDLLPNPLKESFKGSNGKQYETYYYLGFTDNPTISEHILTPQCIRSKTISEEASNVKWCNILEAKRLVCPRRVRLLKNALLFLEK